MRFPEQYSVNRRTKLKDLVEFAKAHSRYYGERYNGQGFSGFDITQLPVTDKQALKELSRDRIEEILCTNPSGIWCRSGGSTCRPFQVLYSKAEWDALNELIGWSLMAAGLDHGDIVANLGAAGDMYGTFLILHEGLQRAPADILEVPIGCSPHPDYASDTLSIIDKTKINTLAGIPSVMVRIAEELLERPARYPNTDIRKILYLGEHMYPTHQEVLEQAFGQVSIRSASYGAMDVGAVGFVDETCATGEFRCLPSNIVEIINPENGAAVTEPFVDGDVLVTSLVRKLMPVIRYPIGDRAHWLEEPGAHPYRKFRLTGRSGDSFNLGPCSCDTQLLEEPIRRYATEHGLNFGTIQFRISNAKGKDELVISIYTRNGSAEIGNDLLLAIQENNPGIWAKVQLETLSPMHIEFVNGHSLAQDHLTCKVLPVVDLRKM